MPSPVISWTNDTRLFYPRGWGQVHLDTAVALPVGLLMSQGFYLHFLGRAPLSPGWDYTQCPWLVADMEKAQLSGDDTILT